MTATPNAPRAAAVAASPLLANSTGSLSLPPDGQSPDGQTADGLTPDGSPSARHRSAERRRTVPWHSLAAVGVLVCWGVVVWTAPRLQVDPQLHDLVLFGHLAALLLGFGAVLVAEWFGLLWILRRRPLASVLHVAAGTHLPIWLGLAGLGVTGVLLAPSQLGTATMVKLGMVLVVALNGLYVRRTQQRMATSGAAVSRSVLVRATFSALVSQGSWWTAITIGFLTTQS